MRVAKITRRKQIDVGKWGNYSLLWTYTADKVDRQWRMGQWYMRHICYTDRQTLITQVLRDKQNKMAYGIIHFQLNITMKLSYKEYTIFSRRNHNGLFLDDIMSQLTGQCRHDQSSLSTWHGRSVSYSLTWTQWLEITGSFMQQQR